MNGLKEISIKNRTYHFFKYMINIKSLDPNKIKIDITSYQNIFIYYIGCVTIKDLSHVKNDSVNPYYL